MPTRTSLLHPLAAFFVLGLSAGGLAGSADAEGPDYARAGPYVLAGAAVATAVSFEDDLNQLGLPARVDSAVGVEARAGFRVAPPVAVEAHFEWVPGFDAKLSNDLLVADGSSYAATVNGKLFLFSDEQFQPYLLFGVGYMRTNYDVIGGGRVDGGGVVVRGGAGLAAHFDEHWFVSADVTYVWPGGRIRGLDYVDVGIGIGYRF